MLWFGISVDFTYTPQGYFTGTGTIPGCTIYLYGIVIHIIPPRNVIWPKQINKIDQNYVYILWSIFHAELPDIVAMQLAVPLAVCLVVVISQTKGDSLFAGYKYCLNLYKIM